ncbi:MAG: hypothetical protein E7G67_10370, partial [Staphylococcus sp.]|nr:hypothetical protein [Staphylococcus sp.]
MAKKSVRHIKIREIISSEQIETQDELVKRLNEYDRSAPAATRDRVRWRNAEALRSCAVVCSS